uniref:thioredoxin domain-containing protein 3 homolog isoform X1 n=3 Tax=Pristiophorus japonicus TaxID=55135 RepID=UPI00398F63F6
MAGKRKEIQIETPIHNETQWDEMFEAKGLSVVDVHQGWCGPCKAILSMFRKLKMEFGDELLHFHTVQASLIPLLKGFEGKCEPAFIFIVAGKIVDYVKGVNAPVINKKIVALLEEEVEFYEKGVERQEVKPVQLYDVEDEIEEFILAATSKKADKLFTIVVIKPNAIITGNDNNIKEQISDAGFQIVAEEMAQLTEEEAKELYEHKKHQRNYEEIVQTMSSGVCDVLLLSEEGEMKDLEYVFDVDEAEITKINDEDSDIRDLACRLFSFFFPKIYEKFQKTEKTLAIIRPQLLELQKDEILEEIANARFTIGRQKEIELREHQVTKFYTLNEKTDLPPEFIEYMISGPILVLALSRDNAIKHWRNLLGPHDIEQAKQDYPLSLRARFAVEDVPFNQLHGSRNIEIAMKELRYFFPLEHTLVAIKPDAVRKYRDAIIAKIQEENFTISAMKSVEMSQEIAAEFYKDYEEEPYFNELIKYISQDPSMIMILTKENAVRDWKELMGPVDLELAKMSFPNSLRAQFHTSILQNGLHGSSNAKHAKEHIKLFFDDTLLDSLEVLLDEGLSSSSLALPSEAPSAVPSNTPIEYSDLVDVEAPTDEQEITTSDTRLAPGSQDVAALGEATDAGTEDVPAPGEAPDAGSEDVLAPREAPDAGSEDVSAPGEAPDADSADVPAPGEAPEARKQDAPAPSEAPDAGIEEVSAPIEAPDAGIEDVSVPIEVPDADSENVPAPGEAPEAGKQDVPAPGEASDAGSEDVLAPREAPDAGSEDVSAPSEAPDAGIEEVSAPSEAPDSSTEDVPVPSEVPDSSTKDVPVPSEVPDSSTEDASVPSEVPDSSTEDVPVPSEVPDSSTEDASVPSEVPDSSTEDASVPSEVPDSSTEDASVPSEVPDSRTEDVPAPGEASDAASEDVPAPGEVPDAGSEDVPAPGEVPDARSEDVPAPDEASDAGSEDVPAPGEVPDAGSKDVPAPGEVPDVGSEDVPAPGEIPDADTKDVSALDEAPDAGSEDVPAPGEAPDASTEDAPAPGDASDAGTEDLLTPGDASNADIEEVSATSEVPEASTEDAIVHSEVPDSNTEDVPAPGDASDAGSEDVPAPAEVPDASSEDVPAPAEVLDAGSEDVPAPGEAPDAGIEETSAPSAGAEDVFLPTEAP